MKGAKLPLLSRSPEKEMEDISKNAEYIELSTRPDFQEEFVEAMSFGKGDSRGENST